MVLGIDPSLTATGLAMISDGKAVLATIQSKPGPIEPRILEIIGHINATLDTFGPRLVAIEGLAYGNNTGQVAERGALHFALRISLHLRNIPFVVVAPNALKKFVTGSGAAEKSMILREVFRKWGVEAADDNQADAVGLAYIAAAIAGEWHISTAGQRDVIAKLTAAPVVKKKRKKAR